MSFKFLNEGRQGNIVEVTPIDTFIDPVSKIRVSNPSNLIDTDFEYGLQPTKWETVELINNTPAFFSKGGDTTIPDLTAIVTNAGTREITVTTAFPHNLASGIPIRVSGTKSVTADGSYIINATPSETTFTYLCRANQPETVSIFDLYSSIITGEFFQGSQISISDSEGIVTDSQGPRSKLTVKTENNHGFGLNTPFYFLNLNSTISQDFQSQNNTSLSFDPTNSATAQSFDGSNTLLQTPVDWSNSGSTSRFTTPVLSSSPTEKTFTVEITNEDWSDVKLGTPLYYSVNAGAGYFQNNPRGVVFVKEISFSGNNATFQVSQLPDGEPEDLVANISGFFQIADQARTFAGNNVDLESQINVSVVNDEPFEFDGGNRGYEGELPEGSDPPATVVEVSGYTSDSISLFSPGAEPDFYAGAMLRYNTTGSPATNLVNNTTYFVVNFTELGPGFYSMTIANLPGQDAIADVGGGSGTQSFTKIGVSVDKNIVHIRNAGYQVEEMIQYGNEGISNVNFSVQKEFYFIEEAFDEHNFKLSANPFRPTTATGGTVSEIFIDGRDYRVHTFTQTGTDVFEVQSVGTNPEAEYLIVAGGGGGGMDMGGGGGGGGVVSGKLNLEPGTYDVRVGFGGQGAPRGTNFTDSTPAGSTQPTQGRSAHPFTIQARNGGDSKFGKPITLTKIYEDDFSTNTQSQYIANNFENRGETFVWDTNNNRLATGTTNRQFAIRVNPTNFSASMQNSFYSRAQYLGGGSPNFGGMFVRFTNGEQYMLGVTTSNLEDGIWRANSLTNTSRTIIDRGFFNHRSQDSHIFETYYENGVLSLYVDGFVSALAYLPNRTVQTFGLCSINQGASGGNFWDNLEGWTWDGSETITAFGGGGGGISNSGNRRFGRRGGSGGGASGYNTSTGTGGTEGIPGQGEKGGHARNRYYGGAGGGAGGAGGGQNTNIHGVGGGMGIRNDILGVPYYWAGGGGASGYSYWGGNGGTGGGGAGAAGGYAVGGDGINPGRTGANGEPFSNTYGGDYSSSSNQDRRGGDAGANTGGGGGGGGHYSGKNKGGDGGSGIVVVRYPILKTRPHRVTEATGGDIIKDIKIDGRNYRIHDFLSSGTFSIQNEANRDIEYLLVGGGGGGGMDMGGGGGAGGYLSGTRLFKQGDYQVTIGAGGFGAPGGNEPGQGDFEGQTQPNNHNYQIPAQAGKPTIVSGTGVSLTAFGGGPGGTTYRTSTPFLHRGGMGASGGGCSGYSPNAGNGQNQSQAAMSNAPSQGNRGGRGGSSHYSGGGGGAGGSGWDGNNRADGGGGRINGIMGLPYYWAGGGGGSGYTRDGGRGGVGGGAGGAVGQGLAGFLGINNGQNGGGGGTSRQANTPGGNGGANTGGGGGGGAHIRGRGGNGGTGIAVFRYPIDEGVGLMSDVQDLVVSLDASNPDSYPGSGNQWINTAVDSDAPKNRLFGLNNVSYSTLAGGSLQFNGNTSSFVRYSNFYVGNTNPSVGVLAGQTPAENNFDGSATYEVWARPTVLDGNARHLFTDGGENEGEIELRSTYIRAYWGGNSQARFNTNLSTNTWYHFVVAHLKDSISGVYTLKLYIDGVLRADSQTNLPNANYNNTSDHGIQSHGMGYGPDAQLDIGYRYAGQISMFRIYGDYKMEHWVKQRFDMHRARFGK